MIQDIKKLFDNLKLKKNTESKKLKKKQSAKTQQNRKMRSSTSCPSLQKETSSKNLVLPSVEKLKNSPSAKQVDRDSISSPKSINWSPVWNLAGIPYVESEGINKSDITCASDTFGSFQDHPDIIARFKKTSQRIF